MDGEWAGPKLVSPIVIVAKDERLWGSHRSEAVMFEQVPDLPLAFGLDEA